MKEFNQRPRNLPYRRLQFLQDFIGALGVSYEDIGNRLGISKVSVYKWFHQEVDDISLSTAVRLIGAYGYKVNFFLTTDNIELQEESRELIDYQERLFFLSSALKKRGITRKILAARLDMNYMTVLHWFKQDDIAVSRLYQIMEACNFSLRIVIRPEAYPIRLFSNEKRHVITDMTISKNLASI